MRVLLDTNIVISRETSKAPNISIGQLFRWLDRFGCTKCVHPISVEEIRKYKDPELVRTAEIKLESYHLLKTLAPFGEAMQAISSRIDRDQNDKNDTILLNELLEDRVDLFITEDRRLHRKAALVGIEDKVYTISRFVEQSIAEHPELVNYKVLSIQKSYFGNVDLAAPFFDSFREDYQGFDKWFKGKSDEIAYVSYMKEQIVGFLYIKPETTAENYGNITPTFTPKKRLKIGTFKVVLNGYRIGERFLKIVFDNALVQKAHEIYVTIFDRSPDQLRLIELLEEWGFKEFGRKSTSSGVEKVFTRDFSRLADKTNPKHSFPFFSRTANAFMVPIWPTYHTELLPDSILNNESPANFTENEPHRNALSKVYISHSNERGLKSGDAILFYRTGGYYAGVATTIGVVDTVYDPIESLEELMSICRKKTFFKDDEIKAFWMRYRTIKPFVVEFLYCYSLKKRPNLAKLIELGIIHDVNSVPRGFSVITMDQLLTILKESNSDESIIVD